MAQLVLKYFVQEYSAALHFRDQVNLAIEVREQPVFQASFQAHREQAASKYLEPVCADAFQQLPLQLHPCDTDARLAKRP